MRKDIQIMRNETICHAPNAYAVLPAPTFTPHDPLAKTQTQCSQSLSLSSSFSSIVDVSSSISPNRSFKPSTSI